MAGAEQQHVAVEVVDPAERGALAEAGVQRVVLGHRRGLRADRREGDLRVRAAQRAGQRAHELHHRAEPADGRERRVERRHLGADHGPPRLRDGRVRASPRGPSCRPCAWGRRASRRARARRAAPRRPPARRRTPSRARRPSCARASRCPAGRRGRAGRPRSARASPAPASPRCSAPRRSSAAGPAARPRSSGEEYGAPRAQVLGDGRGAGGDAARGRSRGAAFERAPVDLGPGDGNSPSVAMDPAGTAHVAWAIAEDVIGYCALPRGARTCAASARLSLDARAGRPEILRRAQDGLLVVVAGRHDLDSDPDDSVWAFTSADGVTWAGPVQIGLGHRRVRRRGAHAGRRGGRPARLRHRRQRLPARPGRRAAHRVRAQPRDQAGRHDDGVRLSRRPRADAQRRHARPARQPGRRLRLPHPRRAPTRSPTPRGARGPRGA